MPCRRPSRCHCFRMVCGVTRPLPRKARRASGAMRRWPNGWCRFPPTARPKSPRRSPLVSSSIFVHRALLTLLGLLPLAAVAVEVTVPREGDLSVTVYRAPDRSAGQMDLDDLDGFALVTETRTVTVPEGDNRIRFEGVADGIEPASAIITGLPGILLEKNRDARLLSPSQLVAAAL